MYISFDIGGTKTNVMSFLTKETESQRDSISFPTSDISSYKTGIQKLSQIALELAGTEVIDGVGISIAGNVDPIKGILIDSVHIQDWDKKNIVQDLNGILKVPVRIENDAVCAALAEISNVVSRGYKNYMFIALGTGVGGAKIMRFSNSIMIFPGDYGHMIVNKEGETCLCGQRGCLEVYASGSGIKKQYARKLEEITERKVWDDLVDYTAQAIMNFIAINPIDKIIFGGGIIFKKIGVIEEIENTVRKMSVDVELPQFELARFYENAQAVGALQLLSNGQNMINMNYY